MRSIKTMVLTGWMSMAAFAGSNELVLTASKDNFARSNQINRNNGASETLAIAHAPNIRGLIAFDLSSATNEIASAELRFRQHNSMTEQISMVVAPMVPTAKNVAWAEGQGNLGTRGQNARPGESCYARCAFPDIKWEAASGEELADLSDDRLWMAPVAVFNGLAWQEGRWVRMTINDLSVLESARKAATPVVTFGVWGKAGNGLYFISSNNSAWPPELHLELKEGDRK